MKNFRETVRQELQNHILENNLSYDLHSWSYEQKLGFLLGLEYGDWFSEFVAYDEELPRKLFNAISNISNKDNLITEILGSSLVSHYDNFILEISDELLEENKDNYHDELRAKFLGLVKKINEEYVTGITTSDYNNIKTSPLNGCYHNQIIRFNDDEYFLVSHSGRLLCKYLHDNNLEHSEICKHCLVRTTEPHMTNNIDYKGYIGTYGDRSKVDLYPGIGSTVYHPKDTTDLINNYLLHYCEDQGIDPYFTEDNHDTEL